MTNILVCLFVATSLLAVTYQPCQPTSFRSTSVYVTTAQPSSVTMSMSPQYPKSIGITAISASNFDALNSEGGACYQPSAARPGGIRRSVDRPDDDDEDDLAIGEIIERSPVGDTPWILFILFAAGYIVLRRKKDRPTA
ncbi:MAG: hypothetical protein IKS76_01380 [Paludibacteraceae bacterium]|nr:hypothetical protein [Paludibacteraceae bacterium]MBR6493491.1 hypothetical protein [Paludibacteraceae bacterium]